LFQKAFNIPAPGDFLQWIQNFNSGLFDQLPETPHFSGVHITKFLLTDADDDLMQDLFDVIIILRTNKITTYELYILSPAEDSLTAVTFLYPLLSYMLMLGHMLFYSYSLNPTA